MKWAFSDESRRGNRYCVVAVVVETHAVKSARKTIDSFRLPRQRRVHMVKERPARRRQFLDLLEGMPIEFHAVAVGTSGRTLAEARERALSELAVRLVELGVTSWHLEGMIGHQQDRDRVVIASALHSIDRGDEVIYDHVAPHTEPMLWAADALAWAILAVRIEPTSLHDVP